LEIKRSDIEVDCQRSTTVYTSGERKVTSMENKSSKRNRLNRSEMKKNKDSLVNINIALDRNVRMVDLSIFTL
jgi:hypothetical protein